MERLEELLTHGQACALSELSSTIAALAVRGGQRMRNLAELAPLVSLALPGYDDEEEPTQSCTVLLLSMSHGTPAAREAVLLGLPTLLRRVRSSDNALVMEGTNCSEPSHRAEKYIVGGACFRSVPNTSSPVPPNAERNGNMERYPCDAYESCWLDRWREMHDARGLLQHGVCTRVLSVTSTNANASNTWSSSTTSRASTSSHASTSSSVSETRHLVRCVAAVSTALSVCEREAPLLQGVPARRITWRPAVTRGVWEPIGAKRRLVPARMERTWRYLSVLPCEGTLAAKRVCLAFKDGAYES